MKKHQPRFVIGEKESVSRFEHGSDGPLDTKLLLTALVALKKGDFSVRLPLDWSGVGGKIADVFNEVVERNERMAHELERISHVVGKEGRLSQRASIGEVGGAWANSITSVNALISLLVHPTSETARVIGAVAKGDLSQTMAVEIEGRPLEEFSLQRSSLNFHGHRLREIAFGNGTDHAGGLAGGMHQEADQGV